MLRITSVLAVLVSLLAFGDRAVAADPPAGRWKILFKEQGETLTFLVAFTETDGKWVGDYLGATVRLRADPTFSALQVNGKSVRFAMTFSGREFISFDGTLSADGKKIAGSISQFGGPLRLTELYASQLKKLDDPFALARENLDQLEVGADLFEAGYAVLAQASAKKLPPADVAAVVGKLVKSAEGYGPRWERTVALRLATSLADQKEFADTALAQVRRVEKMVSPDLPVATQLELTEALAALLTKLGKPEEAKAHAARVKDLVAKDFAEYAKTMMSFKPEAFKGRKAKSDRAVLLEVFTGAECPPCVAVDLATDGLLEAFKPNDLIVLEYHVHVPGPDPLTSPDGMDRMNHYGDAIRGAPTVFANGKVTTGGGGSASAAKATHAALRAAIEPLLETPAPVKLTLTAKPGEKGITAKAVVDGLEKPDEKVRLRFALTEHRVRYAGGNGIRYHHHVVRAMPGGEKGIPLTKKTHEQEVTFNVEEVRRTIEKYLTTFEKTESPFPRGTPPIGLENLMLVAFVQDDATGEVLQAVQVEVK